MNHYQWCRGYTYYIQSLTLKLPNVKNSLQICIYTVWFRFCKQKKAGHTRIWTCHRASGCRMRQELQFLVEGTGAVSHRSAWAFLIHDEAGPLRWNSDCIDSLVVDNSGSVFGPLRRNLAICSSFFSLRENWRMGEEIYSRRSLLITFSFLLRFCCSLFLHRISPELERTVFSRSEAPILTAWCA